MFVFKIKRQGYLKTDILIFLLNIVKKTEYERTVRRERQ